MRNHFPKSRSTSINLKKLSGLVYLQVSTAALGVSYSNSVETPVLRSETWSILCEYYPVDQELRESTLARKRSEYTDLVQHYFGRVPQFEDTVEMLSLRVDEMSQYEVKNFKQIKLDVFRTQPIQLFTHSALKTMMIRLLFVWSMRNPASGYVQGINDLVSPLIIVQL